MSILLWNHSHKLKMNKTAKYCIDCFRKHTFNKRKSFGFWFYFMNVKYSSPEAISYIQLWVDCNWFQWIRFYYLSFSCCTASGKTAFLLAERYAKRQWSNVTSNYKMFFGSYHALPRERKKMVSTNVEIILSQNLPNSVRAAWKHKRNCIPK